MSSQYKAKWGLLSVVSVLGFLGFWHLITSVFALFPEYLLPSPYKIATTFITKLTAAPPDGATLLQHTGQSLKLALTGLGLGITVGVPLGIAMGWYPQVDRFIKPIFNMVRPIPPIAWIPLFILWLGIGLRAKAFIIFVAAVVPCVINSRAGVRETKQVHIWVSKTFGASNFETLLRVGVPSSLPIMFAGLRFAISASWMTLVGAELLASTRGLGYMIQMGRLFGRPDIVIVGMFTIGAIGALLSIVLRMLEKRLIRNGY